MRYKVFTVEQNIDQNIEESNDEKCDHFVAYSENNPVGAGRINYLEDSIAKVERMAVLKDFRGQQIGSKILKCMINYLIGKKISLVTLDAQYHAKNFYENLGFKQEGNIFDEVGIPHIKMVKKLT